MAFVASSIFDIYSLTLRRFMLEKKTNFVNITRQGKRQTVQCFFFRVGFDHTLRFYYVQVLITAIETNMDPKAYREFHESFMKNNNGTSAEDVFVTIIPTIFTTFLTTNLILAARPLDTLTKFGIEFVLVVISTILNLTVLHDRVWEIAFTLLFVTMTAVAKQLYHKTHIAPFVQIPCRRPEYLTLFRAIMNLLTAVCILAVDFRCFPRKLAKTETFGFGLMDTGVGLFVFGNGIVAPELFKDAAEIRLSRKKIKSTLMSSLPLVVLGVVRFFVTNELDYQQHISEYGVHWNFFLTLAVTKVIGTFIIGLLPRIEYTKYAAIVLVTLHELSLQLGLSSYVVDATNTLKRDNFLNANREGIFSILGYVAIYLASVYVAHIIKCENVDKPSEAERPTTSTDTTTSTTTTTEKINEVSGKCVNARQLLKKSIQLLLISMVLWKIVYTLKKMFGVSRRLANMGYVIWIMSIGTTTTALLMLLEIFYYFVSFEQPTPDLEEDNDHGGVTTNANHTPIILSGIAYNALVFFLIANVLTGLVNLSFQTMLIESGGAIIILCAYMLVLCSITTFLFVKKIKLKAW